MKIINGFWVLVTLGVVGAMLSVGTAGAQPFPGGLPKCQADLATCNTNLGTCTTDLSTCNTGLGTCTGDLGTCTTNLSQTQGDLATCNTSLTQSQGDLATCNTNLGTCNTTLTQAQDDLASCNDDLAACQAAPSTVFPGDGVVGPALSYVDNGDGTITDLNTGLMWEKKVASSGCLHCVNDIYNWTDATTTYIAGVNAEGGTGFAGHTDWRVPNVKELQSIVDYGTFNPAVDPSFPGSIAAAGYWSSTSVPWNPSLAWLVDFHNGGVGGGDNSGGLRVRAVRGGQ